MKKYIISDLHGNGEVYDSIMGYLDNVSLVEDIELYINGDLIDRGLDGFRMLNDVIDRINNKDSFKIHYLGGNHELMMYQALKKRKPGGSINHFCDWMNNGGWIIEGELDALEDESMIDNYKDFLGELELYKKFDEKINDNNILLVHASAPYEVHDNCHLKIKDDNDEVEDVVWKREWEYGGFFFPEPLYKNNLKKDGYFIIKGHTPLKELQGFVYDAEQNFMNIDGGCAYYATGNFDVDHIPLVEVKDNKLEILIFNHNNEIIDGYYFDGEITTMSEEDLSKKDIFIDHKYDNCSEKNKTLIKELLSIE